MREDWKIYRNGFLLGFGKAAGIGYLFYRSIFIASMLGCGYGIYGVFLAKRKFLEKQKKEITYQFREGVQGISAALSAGYSIENAFTEARKDLVLLYGEDSLLATEFCRMEHELSLNQSVETVLFDFAKKWDTEDVLHFAQVFQTAKRTGGDLIAITRSTAERVSEKIEVCREIDSMMAGKKMESRIMNAIPLGMILYLWLCSPGFLDCMYIASGRVVMTILMIVYVIAYKWSDRISEIYV